MPKITSVEPQKKNPKRFNIFLDGVFAFGADEDLVVERRLVVEKEISSEDLEKILFESEIGKLMERMYGLFSIRQRSEKEIRDYLRNLSFKRKVKGKGELSEMAVEFLMERLKKKGLVNDEVFAKAWVEARRKSKKSGIRVLKSELFQKGIDRETIELAVSSQQSVVSEENLAKEALEKKIRSWRNLPELEFKQKAVQFLVRRGFDYSIAKEAVDNYLKKEV